MNGITIRKSSILVCSITLTQKRTKNKTQKRRKKRHREIDGKKRGTQQRIANAWIFFQFVALWFTLVDLFFSLLTDESPLLLRCWDMERQEHSFLCNFFFHFLRMNARSCSTIFKSIVMKCFGAFKYFFQLHLKI